MIYEIITILTFVTSLSTFAASLELVDIYQDDGFLQSELNGKVGNPVESPVECGVSGEGEVEEECEKCILYDDIVLN